MLLVMGHILSLYSTTAPFTWPRAKIAGRILSWHSHALCDAKSQEAMDCIPEILTQPTTTTSATTVTHSLTHQPYGELFQRPCHCSFCSIVAPRAREQGA